MEFDHELNTWHDCLVFVQLFLVTCNHVIDIGIGHTEGGFDNRLANPVLDHLALAVNFHNSRLGQAIHIWIEGTNAV